MRFSPLTGLREVLELVMAGISPFNSEVSMKNPKIVGTFHSWEKARQFARFHNRPVMVAIAKDGVVDKVGRLSPSGVFDDYSEYYVEVGQAFLPMKGGEGNGDAKPAKPGSK